MEVGEARVQRIGGVYAGPLLSGGLFRQKSAAGLGGVPVVEFMHGYLLSGAAEEIVLPGRGGDIAESGQPPCIKAVPRQRTHHGAACDGLRQIHEAAALGDTGHPRVYNVSDLPAQGVVFLQLRRVKFRVAAA